MIKRGECIVKPCKNIHRIITHKQCESILPFSVSSFQSMIEKLGHKVVHVIQFITIILKPLCAELRRDIFFDIIQNPTAKISIAELINHILLTILDDGQDPHFVIRFVNSA